MKRLVLIDAHAIIHRCYHALPPLTSSGGEPAGAVYGFVSILLRMLRELKPDYVAAAFDLPGPTFRHVAYERYKAQRPEAPSDLVSQFSRVREAVDAFGIASFQQEGLEADDIIGTIAKQMEKRKGIEVIVVTGDADELQLVGANLKVYSMRKGISDTVIYDAKAVKRRYGLTPKQLIDFKALKGDPSDNIPGVKGIGEKTATQLLQEFGTLKGVYAALKKKSKKISSVVVEKLKKGEEDAFLARELVEIKTDADIDFQLDNTAMRDNAKTAEVRAFLQKMGFVSLLKRISNGSGEAASRASAKSQAAFAAGKQPTLLESSSPSANTTLLKDEGELKSFFASVSKDERGIVLLDSEIYIVPRQGEARLIPTKFLSSKIAKDFFENSAGFVTHDAKQAIHFLRSYGIELGVINFDLRLADYVVNSSSRDFSYLGIIARALERMVSSDPRQELTAFFPAQDAILGKLESGPSRRVLEEIELPLVRILTDMEDRGILLDRDFLKKLGIKIDNDIKLLIKKIHDAAGEEFNLNSSQQLSHVLFDTLKINPRGLRKTEKGGVISTRESELEKLRDSHPIAAKILEYRELAKLKSTYVEPLPLLTNKKTGRVHTTFNQTGAATGRLSSSDPNLQNIPIMTELGREIRKAFIVEKGFMLASFDYSQIELRVAAHLANDKKMIDAFKKGLDIHSMTASEIYNVPLDKVTPDLRRAAKTLNFGVLYGMGSQAFAESTGMSREEARKFIDEYFSDFFGIKQYLDDTKRFAEENGFVETMFGRKRYISEIHSPNWQIKREAERMAINHPIQGSAADLVKMAMIALDQWLKKEKLEEDARMLLQVHDELVFEIKESALKKTAPKIKKIMEGVAELKVPLVVDVKAGKNWGEQKEIS